MQGSGFEIWMNFLILPIARCFIDQIVVDYPQFDVAEHMNIKRSSTLICLNIMKQFSSTSNMQRPLPNCWDGNKSVFNSQITSIIWSRGSSILFNKFFHAIPLFFGRRSITQKIFLLSFILKKFGAHILTCL